MGDVRAASLAELNKAAVTAAKAGRHDEALQLYEQLFAKLDGSHLTHRQLFTTHSNKAASHLALGQHTQALQEAKLCLERLTAAAASAGLSSPSRHPHWPKACLRMGQAFLGLKQHQQAAAAFEAGLTAEPLNPDLKSGMQQAHQGLASDLLTGRTLTHIKALPSPATPERITLAPHNSQGLRPYSSTLNRSGSRVQRRGYQVGWSTGGDLAAVLLEAAAAVTVAADAGDGSASSLTLHSALSAGGVCSFDASSWRLPQQLLTPAAAEADVGLRDMFEYLCTQCAIRAPKQYLYRTLPDAARMSSWWAATTAAVAAVRHMGRAPRVLLLGAKAGVLAVASLRAGAQHVTCVESSPYLAAACRQVLLDNAFHETAFTIISTLSPATLKLGPKAGTDVPNVCNCLVADMLDDGVLSGGLIPAVSNALEELLVREEPVLVPQRLTIMAQAVGVQPSVVEVEVAAGAGGLHHGDKVKLDLSALDPYRWTPSQALPSPLDPDMLLPLSRPQPVWDMPLADVVADQSSVQHLDVELTTAGSWCATAFWAELQLFDDITYSTAGPWNAKGTSGLTANQSRCTPLRRDSSSSDDSSSSSSSSSGGGSMSDPRSSDEGRSSDGDCSNISGSSNSSAYASCSTYTDSESPDQSSSSSSSSSSEDSSAAGDVLAHIIIPANYPVISSSAGGSAAGGGFKIDGGGSSQHPTGPAQPLMAPSAPTVVQAAPSLDGTKTAANSTKEEPNMTTATITTSSRSSSKSAVSRYPTGPALPLLLTYPTEPGRAGGAATAAPNNVDALQAQQQQRRRTAGLLPAAADPGTSQQVEVFKAPPSHQPALCWLPGALPVAEGDVYPLIASHNTVRCMFTLKEADYSYMFQQEPSFPHSHFAVAADRRRLSAYTAALQHAISRAVAAKQAQAADDAERGAATTHTTAPAPAATQYASNSSKPHKVAAATGSMPKTATGAPSCSTAASEHLGFPASAQTPTAAEIELKVLDVGCGSGVLSLLAAAVLSAHTSQTTSAGQAPHGAPQALTHRTAASTSSACGFPPRLSSYELEPAGAVAVKGSVVGVELTAPLAAVAQRAVAMNGAAALVSIVQADAGSCRRGEEVPLAGADIIVLDVFDAGLIGHGVLGLAEMVKSSLASDVGAQVLPASATLHCMGIEVLTVSSWDIKVPSVQPIQQEQSSNSTAIVEVCLQALQAYRWSDEPDTVQMHHLPHKRLTAPVKLADFDLCAPVGTPYPKEMQAELQVTAAGQLNALVVWFDLHLAERVTVTSAPLGFTTGGRTCSSGDGQQQGQHYWGQALHYLSVTADVLPGDELSITAARDGHRLNLGLAAAKRPPSSSSNNNCSPASSSSCSSSSSSCLKPTISNPGCECITNACASLTKPEHTQHTSTTQHNHNCSECNECGDDSQPTLPVIPVWPAVRPPWLRPGAGIEDPAVWSVKKCQQLLGQMLMRAPGAKFPPIWKDLQIMQVHAGSLGLCAATVGAVSQELTMREALSVASQKQLVTSPFAVAEAAGTQPPVVWR